MSVCGELPGVWESLMLSYGSAGDTSVDDLDLGAESTDRGVVGGVTTTLSGIAGLFDEPG
jgi:hypothetical protein